MEFVLYYINYKNGKMCVVIKMENNFFNKILKLLKTTHLFSSDKNFEFIFYHFLMFKQRSKTRNTKINLLMILIII